MLFPISQLIEGRGEPLCVNRSTLVREALTLMIEYDYSQLPVVNEDGKLIGLFSETSLIQFYFHMNNRVSLLDLSVNQCMIAPKEISLEDDIFEALNLLDNAYAVIVTNNDNKPVGILTDYDTTHFFRDLSEGLIIVEDIEVTLRNNIEAVLDSEQEMDAALVKTFGLNNTRDQNRDPNRPLKEFDMLTFYDHIMLVTTEGNWEKFKPFFNPKEIFIELMRLVREIRNKLAHFRGEIDLVEKNALDRARDWLSNRPKPIKQDQVEIKPNDIQLPPMFIGSSELKIHGKYYPLLVFLEHQKDEGQSLVSVRFSQIEEVIKSELPNSAFKHRSWWSNAPASHTQAEAWINAGWIVDDVDFNNQEVTFRQTQKALYYPFFSDLLKGLKSKRPGITQIQSASLYNYLTFGSGISGFKFSWDLPRGSKLRVELYIDKGDKADNKNAFDKLIDQKAEIEEEIGLELDWERIDDARASRISSSISFDITDPPDAHEKAKEWGLKTMLNFVDVFRPKLREL